MADLVEASWAILDGLRAAPEAPEICEDDFVCRCGGVKMTMHENPVCTSCGKVDEHFISDEAEWNFHPEAGQDQCRVGNVANLDHFSADWAMGTKINITYGMSWHNKKLAHISHHISMNHRDRALFHSYAKMDETCTQVLKLPPNIAYAARTKWREFNTEKLTRGKVREGVKANCVFQACRDFGVPRSYEEIAEAFGIAAKDMSRTTEVFSDIVPEQSTHITGPADVAPRLFNNITDIPESARGRVLQVILRACRETENVVDLMGRKPKAVAAAIIFKSLATTEYPVTKQKICEICAITAPTLNTILQILSQ